MDVGGGGGSGRDKGLPPVTKQSKFAVYQNATLSAALTANSLQPSKSALLFIFFLSSASAFALFSVISRGKYAAGVPIKSPSKETKDQSLLTTRQLGLLGLKPKVESVITESSKKPPKSKPILSASDVLVPIHQQITSSNRNSRVGSDKSNAGSANKITSFSTPSKSQSSPSSLYLVAGASSPLPSTQYSPGMDSAVSTPWSGKRTSSTKEIATEEQLEQFLAEVDEKIAMSAGKQATPPPTIRGFGVASPNTVASPANTSGTKRSTPLRPVRMSPGSQKFTTPPKKGEGELPLPISMEESIEAFKHLGIYPQIEQWRDRLRQWFSSVVLNPLLSKIQTSHFQVMQAAAKLGISITISQVGCDSPTSGTPATMSSVDRKEWQPAFTLDEDGLLYQLRATLMQALDAYMPKLPLANLQQSPQQNPMIPIMQECVDAITEHQRLRTLMKGEWAKGLLPHINVPEDFMVQRIRELAEGTCLKNYEYLGSGDVYDKKKWTLELPTDSHLLLYLFCAFLEHPKWMLHVDPTSYAGVQSSKNPLFLGVLPPKERFPEKYISVISGVPSTLHPGACILVVGKQSPPIFALYWDKKLQFSLQVGKNSIVGYHLAFVPQDQGRIWRHSSGMSTGEKKRLNGEAEEDDDVDVDGDGLDAWERTYTDERSWEALQEDESGLLRPIDNKAIYHAQYRRRLRSLSTTAVRIQKGLIRFLYIVVDLSRAASEMDFRPSRMVVIAKHVEAFIREFFDQNPLSQIGLVTIKDGVAHPLTELGGSPESHIKALMGKMECSGDSSLQNALDLVCGYLDQIPSYGHREVLILYSALSTCDPGDITETIQKCKESKIRCSVIGLSAEMFICKHLCQETGGLYSVAMDEVSSSGSSDHLELNEMLHFLRN
ncbi:hypothetical protein GH714_013904 [Hevea brasiliensis]|uniref:VWFA domain-containing protein n=1 Tax=Hevea brasiliensis TaxID=3981 RepID=A0A6A6LKE9_HEVBR|nr:hypothetical protein GH714_013904 [Hevea brasiliensis]